MGAAATATPAVRPKELHFPLSVEWVAERRVVAQMEGKPTIEITPPPVFRGTDPTTSSPEDFFVVAAASCLAVTFAGLAATVGLTYAGLRVDGDGVVGLRADGRSGFTRLLPRFELDVDPAHEAQAREPRREGRGRLPRLRLARPPGRDRDRGSNGDLVRRPPRSLLAELRE